MFSFQLSLRHFEKYSKNLKCDQKYSVYSHIDLYANHLLFSTLAFYHSKLMRDCDEIEYNTFE